MFKAPQGENILGTPSRKIPEDERSPFSREIMLNKKSCVWANDPLYLL
ncbi:MAG: hypothetical protein F6K23_31555 [Okeania sp. SIO2C9]|nr:hypothetical protein [Okeania sp. SIO2C9]NEQ77150.1 hypothetical protein [Okeania sp. SIO2C9]